MSDERKPGDTESAESAPQEDEDRAAILARRNRFVRAALTGLAGAAVVAACGGDTDEKDASPNPCLSPVQADSGTPQPCLKVAVDSGTDKDASDGASDATVDASDAATDADAAATDAAIGDATPLPCLSPLPPDSGND